MNAAQKLPENDPMLKAWNTFKGTREYQLSLQELRQHCDTDTIIGAMWFAFGAGWMFSGQDPVI